MSVSMTFRQLYQHLETYVSDAEHRWKLVMRVKRGLADSNSKGGFGWDQCYFEGELQEESGGVVARVPDSGAGVPRFDPQLSFCVLEQDT